ncbi:hypothetical protein K492DRAFT_236629 [Lichtheimia hyalospora FSU 10163]|nr:hypothetical protein K492DRAFT_236629 [Lichtheimia hyalospora FSU 10163]
MDPWANNVLMTTRWFCVETSQDVYYVKHYLDSTDYCVLVTNLRQVWSDTAHAPDIIAQAHRHFLDIDTNDQVEQLLTELKVLLNDLDRCMFQRDHPHDDRSKDVLKIICKENKGFTSLSWSFECQPVDDASIVLYDHFISPMLCMMSSKEDNGKKCLDDAWLTGLAAASKTMVDAAAATAASDAEKDDHESVSDVQSKQEESVSPGTMSSLSSSQNKDTPESIVEDETRNTKRVEEEIEQERRQHRQKRKRLFR